MGVFNNTFGNTLATQGAVLNYFLKDSEGFTLIDSEGFYLKVKS